MKKDKVCSFFGHRKINVTEELIQEVKDVVEKLIINNTSIFLFGSRSQFDVLCHTLVTELQQKYPHIERKNYTCKSEECILEKDREKAEQTCWNVLKKEVHLLGFEEEVEFKTKYTAGKASYVERNQAMINDSDICIFYYDENYQPELRQYSKRSFYYQPKSGTRLAYEYAKRKKKEIINIIKIHQ